MVLGSLVTRLAGVFRPTRVVCRGLGRTGYALRVARDAARATHVTRRDARWRAGRGRSRRRLRFGGRRFRWDGGGLRDDGGFVAR